MAQIREVSIELDGTGVADGHIYVGCLNLSWCINLFSGVIRFSLCPTRDNERYIKHWGQWGLQLVNNRETVLFRKGLSQRDAPVEFTMAEWSEALEKGANRLVVFGY